MSDKDKIHLATSSARNPRRVYCLSRVPGIEIVHLYNEGAIEEVTCIMCLIEFRTRCENKISKNSDRIDRAQARLDQLP